MTSNTTFTSWITCPKPNPKAKIRLFCFPYSGGSATIFRTWANDLPDSIELCPIEIPGRGKQIKLSPYTKIEPLIQATATNIIPYLNKPYAFFGYSMGALISFELTRLLRSDYNSHPLHLFIAAYHAPQLPSETSLMYQLTDTDFLNEIYQLNGTPKVVQENPELIKFFLPVIRADFTVLDTYVYSHQSPLNCPITAFGGLQDSRVSYNALSAWEKQTTAPFLLHEIDGNHFFINTAKNTLLNLVIQSLQSYI